MAGKTNEKVINTIIVFLFLIFLLLMLNLFTKNMSSQAAGKKTIISIKYAIVIDTDENNIYLLKNGKTFKTYCCATGAKETPSPLGYFKIIKKSHWGEGFGGYFLGLDCTWGIYGIHGTTNQDSVGYDSSHGCFRMYSEDIEELYSYAEINTPVLITGGCYGVFGSSLRNIGPGMYGGDVRAIENRLKDLGFYKGQCNGMYNDYGFREAIHDYQEFAGLEVSDYINKKMYASLGFVQIE